MKHADRLATVLATLASPWMPAPAGAQIVEAELDDSRAVRAQKKPEESVRRVYILERDGRRFLRGEPLVEVEPERYGEILWTDERPFQLFVSDLDDPEDVPYRWQDGQRIASSDARIAVLPGKDLAGLRMIAPHLTLANLADEVRERRAAVAELERQRDRCEHGSEAWFDAHFLLLEKERRLQILLERYGFEPAARKLDPDLRRQTRAGAADPRASRGPQALESIRAAETPSRLVDVAQAVSGGQDRFSLHQSTHLRILHDERIDGAKAIQLLTLGEEIIEGFRREFIDPYECSDLIPDRAFSEFWFGPDEDEKHARYLEEYYLLSWGTEEEKREHLRWWGFYPMRSSPPEFLSFGRAPFRDLFGLVAHRVGEQLVRIHFEAYLRDGANPGVEQDWLQEAMGVYMSLEYNGANTTSCTAQRESSVSKAAVLREKERHERPREYHSYLAREFARPLDQLVLRGFGELGLADASRGWSLLCYLASDGQRGQDVLHSACKLSRERASFLEDWREELRWMHGDVEGDPIRELEKLWRATLPGPK